MANIGHTRSDQHALNPMHHTMGSPALTTDVLVATVADLTGLRLPVAARTLAVFLGLELEAVFGAASVRPFDPRKLIVNYDLLQPTDAQEATIALACAVHVRHRLRASAEEAPLDALAAALCGLTPAAKSGAASR